MFITTKTKINNEKSLRHFDDNGFLFVEESPILSTDVLQYLGKELLGGNEAREIDGLLVEPEKIYTVRIPADELEKAKHTFELLPILDGHDWVGVEGDDTKGLQEGSTGQNAEIKENKLFLSLKFTGKKIIDKIKEGIEELSASYQHNLSRDVEKIADFIATGLEGNHLALVPKGRCGSSVCVYNQDIGVEMVSSENEFALLIDGKKIDLRQFFEQEQKEEAHEETGSIEDVENSADEIKPEEKTETQADEKPAETEVEKKVEEKPAEETKTEDEEVSLLDEVKKVLMGKVEDEKLAKVLEILSNKEVEVENACGEEEKAKAENSIKEIMDASKRAYNEAISIIGDNFNAVGMNAEEIYTYALNQRGVKTENRSCAELQAMVESLKSVKVDNSFNPSVKEETDDSQYIEINL